MCETGRERVCVRERACVRESMCEREKERERDWEKDRLYMRPHTAIYVFLYCGAAKQLGSIAIYVSIETFQTHTTHYYAIHTTTGSAGTPLGISGSSALYSRYICVLILHTTTHTTACSHSCLAASPR